MDAYRAITSKRDSRRYLETPISAEHLERILQAGRMAGSARAAEPVRLVVIESQEQRDAIAACGNSTEHLRRAPLVVAIVLVPEFGVVGSPFTLFRGPFDAGRVGQNMMLAAWELGIHSCPASMHDEAAAAKVLLLPEGHYVINCIGFGYPAETRDPMTGTRPRQPLEEFVHRERW
jgi:nitroreductase